MDKIRWHAWSPQHSALLLAYHTVSTYWVLSHFLPTLDYGIPLKLPSPSLGFWAEAEIQWARQVAVLWDFPSWKWLTGLRLVPISVTLWTVTSPDFVLVVEVADKLVFYIHSHFWFMYKIHQIYFFCKDLVTEPEFKRFSWSSSNITLVFWNISWAYFVPVCSEGWPHVPFVGVVPAVLCQVDFR